MNQWTNRWQTCPFHAHTHNVSSLSIANLSTILSAFIAAAYVIHRCAILCNKFGLYFFFSHRIPKWLLIMGCGIRSSRCALCVCSTCKVIRFETIFLCGGCQIVNENVFIFAILWSFRHLFFLFALVLDEYIPFSVEQLNESASTERRPTIFTVFTTINLD